VPTALVQGLENLPRPFTKTIIISNHQSTLDVFILARLCFLNFYVVFKREILFYPGVGTAMWLSRYLSVNRKDKESGRTLIRQATAVLNRGLSLCWFPEGTRKIDGSSGPLGPFKPGAFVVARDAGAAILPVTISGARRLMPAGGAPQLRTGRVVLTIHPPISSAGKDVEALMDATRAAIVSGLREIDALPAPKAAAAAAGNSPAAGSPVVSPGAAGSASVAALVESKKVA